MSAHGDGALGPRDDERAAEVQRVRVRFLREWDGAFEGGPVPDLEASLAGLLPPERDELREVLGPVEAACRAKLSAQFKERRAAAASVRAADRRGDEWSFSDGLSGSGFMVVPPAPRSPGPGRLTDEWDPPAGHGLTDDAPEPATRAAVEPSSAATDTKPKPSPAATARSGPTRTSRSEARPPRWPEVSGYEILSELGRGGMGVVYKARQRNPRRLVALKMVLAGAHAGAEQLARFQSEARAVARLKHPNIVEIYEIGEREGLPYFSLEFVEGGSLAQRAGGKPQPPREAAWVVGTLARAMAAAHSRKVVHRDLKPANVLISSDGQPKITDFGLAKNLEGDSRQTRTGTILGTPAYMAPEQATGVVGTTGPSADQYALGAILYELLTGRPPFQAATPLDTLEQVRTQEPVPPTRLQPKVPVDLETICLKALQKDPARRYPGCAAFATDIARFLRGEPVHARPVPRLARGAIWCRRNPRLAALAGTSIGITVALLIGLGAAVAVLDQKNRELRRMTEAALVRPQVVSTPAPSVVSLPENREAEDRLRELFEGDDAMIVPGTSPDPDIVRLRSDPRFRAIRTDFQRALRWRPDRK